MQRSLWLAEQLGGRLAYNTMPLVSMNAPGVSPSEILTACRRIIDVQPALRTTFEAEAGHFLQRLHTSTQLDFRVVDDPNPDVRGTASDLVCEGFDLKRLPLMRLRLVTTGEDTFSLIVGVHHIIFDGYSQVEFVRVLGAALSTGRTLPDVSHSDYCRLCEETARRELRAIEPGTDFWTRRLRGQYGALREGPIHTQRPEEPRPPESAVALLEERETVALRSLADATGVSTFAVCATILATWEFLNYDKTFAFMRVAVAIRGKDSSNIMGCFVNTVGVGVRLEKHDSSISLITRLAEELKQVLGLRDMPYSELVHVLQSVAQDAQSPVNTSSLITYRKVHEAIPSGGLHLSLDPTLPPGNAKAPLFLRVVEATGGLHFNVEVSSTFDYVANNVADSLVSIARSMVDAPHTPIRELVESTHRR